MEVIDQANSMIRSIGRTKEKVKKNNYTNRTVYESHN
jgi:hypothetical protein